MGKLRMLTTSQVLGGVKGALNAAELGFVDLHLSEDAVRQLVGLRNAVIWGHSVTYILQKLRTREDDFDTWYEPLRAEMISDPLMKFFHDLRSVLLKEGLPEMRADLHRRANPKPVLAVVGVGEDRFGVWIAGVSTGILPAGQYTNRQEFFLSRIRPVTPPQRHLGTPTNDATMSDHVPSTSGT